jgi:diguanylate cyclase (GGDEF)-like protein
MVQQSMTSWRKGELYDTLCLLLTAECVWIAGQGLGLFKLAGDLVARYGLSNLVMFGFCMSFGVLAASVHKSLKLRREMQARIRAEAHADELARHDSLTGLANRRLLKERIEQALRAAESDHAHAVMVVDLDRFKAVNDLYGHAAGDAVLCAAAERLSGLIPRGAVAARLGGDEFALLVRYRLGSDELVRLGETIVAGLARPTPWGDTHVEVGATVGIAVSPLDGADAEALLHAADVAMYRGKKEGRGTFRFFEPAMDSELKARAQMEQELRAAVASGEIQPFFQPLVSLRNRELLGFEVLARWNHPTRGLISPVQFIQLAEDSGLISELSYSVWRQACLEARDWPAHLQLAVNVSPHQLTDRGLPERILAILTETGFAPGRLEVEITETALVNDIEAARVILNSLRNVGIRVALDDFGTGYSSLYHLRELRFDKIKIDRSYVQSLPGSAESTKIVDAILGLGKSLGLSTTAEGIETEISSVWLAEQGCSFGQGYLFGAPMPGDQARKMFAAAADETMREQKLLVA